MQLSLSTLNAINKQITKVFNDTIKLPTWYQKIARKRIVPNSTFKEKWLHSVPEIQQYKIPSQPEKPVVNTFGGHKTFDIDDYAEILAIPKKDIEDDELSQYPDVLRSMTESLVRLPQKLIELILNDGEITECMDGGYLFANSHDPGDGVSFYDNLFAGTGTSIANIKADLATVRVAMYNYKAANGVQRGLIPTLAMIPMDLDMKFKEILQNTSNPEANYNTENIFKGILTEGVITGVRFDDANDWYLKAGNAPDQKPFTYAVKKGYDSPRLTPKIKDTDDNVYYLDEYHWLIETHAKMIAGWPAYIAKVVNA